MAVPPGRGITVAAGVSHYQITSLGFRTASARHHPKVVNGEGAVRRRLVTSRSLTTSAPGSFPDAGS
jgi:hypothetical protein